MINKFRPSLEEYYPKGATFGEDRVMDKYGPIQAAFRDEIHRQRTITNIKIFGLYAGALLMFAIFTYAIIMFSLAF